LVRGRCVIVLEFVGRPPAGVVVVIGEHGGGGAECVGAGECAALGGSGGGGDEGLEEFVRDAVQAVHCLCTADTDPVQLGEFGGHGVGDHVGVDGGWGGWWWVGTTTTRSGHDEHRHTKPEGTGAAGAAGAAVESGAPVEVPRRRLERAVRAAASAASTEAQWLARLGELGVAVEPCWARGGDRVVGYRVALADTPREPGGSKAVWFGGGTLAHDLTLPALRAGWTGAADPATTWRRAPIAAPAPTEADLGSTVSMTNTQPAPEQVSRDFSGAVTTLRGAVMTARLLGGDGAEVARAARDTGGLLAAIAEHAPTADRRRLAAASAHLARVGQVEHGQARGVRSPLSPGFAQVAVTVLTAAAGGSASTAVLLAQVARLTRTVAELHAVQHRVAAALDTARAAELLAPYATPTAPTPDPAPPQPVIMPNQEQLDAMLGSTRAQRFAAETRNRTRGGEPGTYRPPPPTQEPGRER